MAENLYFMKSYAPKAADVLRQQKQTKVTVAGLQALANWSEALAVVEGVEDAAGTPGSPCSQQSWAAILKLRRIFGIPVKRQKKPKAASGTAGTVPTQKPIVTKTDLPSCGPGPYCAKIVSSRNLDESVWAGPHTYKTEDDACRAVIRKAVREANLTHRWTVNTDCIRHWVTERKEHVMDFGSHAYYGVVTGKETV